ncbi:diacylglycerol kinase [Marinospirillum perlucidum]|uniref:diacylglycerol kinase n=1 Tax=Marinospirillum perlucidum TaxID=1982602 RepID=UPI000DF1C1B9|nr:diacylglycerol kinase [Marinospirillum perlucidum]
MKSGYRGWRRLLQATRFSWQGLRAGWNSEAAIRQEILTLALLLPLALALPVTALEKALLISVSLLVLVVELLNSAIEALVDRVGSDYHPLSGKAKDLGSAAVLVALVLAASVWVLILWPLVSDHFN